MKDEIKELTAGDFDRAIPRRLRDRLVRGDFKSGEESQLYGASPDCRRKHSLWLWGSVCTRSATGSRADACRKDPHWCCCASLLGTQECSARTWLLAG